jgi:hypothetical protein
VKKHQEEKAERECCAAVHAFSRGGQPEQSKETIDEHCNRGLANPSQGERRNRNSELRSGDVAIEMRESSLHISRAVVAALRHLVDSTSSNGDKREFGGDEKRVERYQKQNDTEADRYCTGAKVFGRTLKKGQEIHID